MVISFAVVFFSLLYVAVNYVRIRKMDEGTEEMKQMSAIIRDGASTFLVTEFRVIAVVVAVLALAFSLFVEKLSGITLLIGALMSSLACIIGMKSATYANVRTANRARETQNIGQTVKVALCTKG